MRRTINSNKLYRVVAYEHVRTYSKGDAGIWRLALSCGHDKAIPHSKPVPAATGCLWCNMINLVDRGGGV